jgi:tRNA dimethylallyltransferase
MTKTPSPNPLFIAGATATGKSDVALVLAEKLGGEIISVDSMQVYRGLDIGTAKPEFSIRERIPHHLIDVAELTEAFDAAQFVRLAAEAVSEIKSRNRTPIYCGGTGLYFKAYLEGLGDAPRSDAALRAELEKTPAVELLEELKAKDPATFEKIDRQNPRRIIRALEVIRLTGRPFSEQRAQWNDASVEISGARFFTLKRSTEDLRKRIDRRVDEMFRRGLVAEVESLLARGLEKNRTAMQAIGYRQVVEHLRGARGLDETIELVKIRTRQFAKRQTTWFKRQNKQVWIECAENESASDIALRILATDETRIEH